MAAPRKNQQAEEQRVTEQFIETAHLPVFSTESRNPPEPDIYCFHRDDGPMYFELMRISDENIEEMRNKRNVDCDNMYRIRNTYLGKFRIKLDKVYICKYPVELLCYHTNGTIDTDNDVISKLNYIIDGYPKAIQFRRIWYFGVDGVHLLLSQDGETR